MKKGYGLIMIIVFSAIFLALCASLTKIVFNSLACNKYYGQRLYAFYLAEAGLEKGKYLLNQDPNWFSSPPGQENILGKGTINIIREISKNKLYSTGKYKDSSVILEFNLTSKKWEEL